MTTKTPSQTIAYLNERVYQQFLDSNSELVARIRADIDAGMSPLSIKAQMDSLYDGTSPAERRTVYQIAQHIAAGRAQ